MKLTVLISLCNKQYEYAELDKQQFDSSRSETRQREDNRTWVCPTTEREGHSLDVTPAEWPRRPLLRRRAVAAR